MTMQWADVEARGAIAPQIAQEQTALLVCPFQPVQGAVEFAHRCVGSGYEPRVGNIGMLTRIQLRHDVARVRLSAGERIGGSERPRKSVRRIEVQSPLVSCDRVVEPLLVGVAQTKHEERNREIGLKDTRS